MARDGWRLLRAPLRLLERIRGAYEDHPWAVVAILWLMAFLLGAWGVRRQFVWSGDQRSLLDSFYRALQLFLLEDGMVVVPGVAIPWQLEVARFVAPLVAVFTGLTAVLAVFRDELSWLRLRHLRGHTVICGLGEKGALLLERFRARGERVVAIEQDQENDTLRHARDQGVICLGGDATHPKLLARARVDRARRVIAVCGDDGTNAEIAARCGDLVGGAPGRTVQCLAHVTDPRLCALLREREIMGPVGGSFWLELFSIYDIGARAMLRDYPAFGGDEPDPPHVLVVGLGRMGESLVVQLARSWAPHCCRGDRPLRLTIVDRAADAKLAGLRERYPQLASVCRMVSHELDIQGPGYQRAAFLREGDRPGDIAVGYICLGSDADALIAALAIRSGHLGRRVPIVVRMRHRGGLAALLRDVSQTDDRGVDNLHAFALLDRTCDPELLLATTRELIAREIHAAYLAQQQGLGITAEENPALVPWEQLLEDYRDSNLRQADGIGARLQEAGCTIAPLVDWDAERFQFTDDEIGRLARREHEEWMRERLAADWRYAPGRKDPVAKTSPDLVAWEKLSEPAREKDRNAVRVIPHLLAEAGFQVERVGPSGPRSASG